MEGERGEDITVPKGAKADGVKGTGSTMSFEEDAGVDILYISVGYSTLERGS